MPFLTLIRRFVPPYRRYMALNILFNLLSTILSLFSFAAIIPVLQILFGLTSVDVQWTEMSTISGLQETIAAMRENMYFLLNEQIALHGASYVLLLHMLEEILRSRNTCEDQRRAFLVDGCIRDTGEMEVLVGRQMKPVVHHPHVYRSDLFGTLGDDDSVGFECS